MKETNTPTPAPLDAMRVIEGIAGTPEYKRNLDEGYPYQRAMARAALELVGMHADTVDENTYDLETAEITRDMAINALVGTLPAYADARDMLDRNHNSGYIPYAQFSDAKRQAARFNHAVKTVIETDRSLQATRVVDTVTTLYGIAAREKYGDNRAAYERDALSFKKSFEGRVRGMQHEVVARQVIEAINSVDPVIDPETGQKLPRVLVNPHVSAEDDLKGVDMYVTLDGVTFPIDIKASERTADNIRRKSSHPNSILTSGFTSQELGGNFGVNAKRACKAAPAMLEKLYAARQEFLDQQATNVEVGRLALAA